MKLWAATETITFNDLIDSISEPVDLSLSMTADYFGRSRGGPGFVFDLDRSERIVQVPALARNSTFVTGVLCQQDHERGPRFSIESSLKIAIHTYCQDRLTMLLGEEVLKQNTEPIIVFGQLHCGSNWGDRPIEKDEQFYKCMIHRFESLCLDQTQAAFGTWKQVSSYAEIMADPDITSACVLLAEVEILEKSWIPSLVC